MKKKLNENQLREYIKEYIHIYLNFNFGSTTFLDHRPKICLTEGLTCTYGINKINDILHRKYNFKELHMSFTPSDANQQMNKFDKNKMKTTENDNWFYFYLYFQNGINNNGSVVNDIIHTCDACGWYLAECVYFIRNGLEQTMKVMNKENFNPNNKMLSKTPLRITFRAKFNAEYKESSIKQYLYHIAPLRVLDKIKKQGLTPRANGRIASHPERVYLFVDYPNNWKEIADEFRKSNKKEKYVLLGVNWSYLNPNTKFYYDSNAMLHNKAVYTNEPIPPTAISLIDTEENIEH